MYSTCVDSWSAVQSSRRGFPRQPDRCKQERRLKRPVTFERDRNQSVAKQHGAQNKKDREIHQRDRSQDSDGTYLGNCPVHSSCTQVDRCACLSYLLWVQYLPLLRCLRTRQMNDFTYTQIKITSQFRKNKCSTNVTMPYSFYLPHVLEAHVYLWANHSNRAAGRDLEFVFRSCTPASLSFLWET